jgi:hypothetical protein
MLCRVKTRGEGSRGPAGGGVVGGEGLRVFQHWHPRPSSRECNYQKMTKANQPTLFDESRMTHQHRMSKSLMALAQCGASQSRCMGGQWLPIDPPSSAGSCFRMGQRKCKPKRLCKQEFPGFKGPNQFLLDFVNRMDQKQGNEGNHP